MAWYRVFIEGRNFVLNVDGKVGRYGFYQTVVVDAADEHEAGLEAIKIVESDRDLKPQVQNKEDDPPRLAAESVAAVDGSGTPGATSTGRVFFLEKRWWQFWR